jgi:hypothetical protein
MNGFKGSESASLLSDLSFSLISHSRFDKSNWSKCATLFSVTLLLKTVTKYFVSWKNLYIFINKYYIIFTSYFDKCFNTFIEEY